MKNLMLRQEVVDAVEEGNFHIYPITTIDEGISLLTGHDAGELQTNGEYPMDTVNWEVKNKLRQLAEKVNNFSADDKE